MSDETQERWQSEQIDQLAVALVQLQSRLPHVERKGENPYHHSTYATLADSWDVLRPVLAECGLAVVQTFRPSAAGTLEIETLLAHTSGQWKRGVMTIPATMVGKDGKVYASPQGTGSAATYGRRYGLQAITGLTPEDDDAEAAEAAGPTRLDASAAFAQRDADTPRPKASTPTAPVTGGPIPTCPKCGGPMEDRRKQRAADIAAGKRKKSRPSFSCLKETCGSMKDGKFYTTAIFSYSQWLEDAGLTPTPTQALGSNDTPHDNPLERPGNEMDPGDPIDNDAPF